jgi:hypothetical protein
MKQDTQLTKLARYFESYGSISNIEAQAVFRIRALPRRISDLEQRGYRFTRRRMKDVENQRYVRYELERAPIQAAQELGAI